MKQSGRFSLSLLGPFSLRTSDGEPISISSKKGAALIAMLATAPNGERSRGWLREKLWGSRQDDQSRASLRRELSNLRRIVNASGETLIAFDSGPVRLRLDLVEPDVVRGAAGEFARRSGAPRDTDFLEGMDIRGEEGFEDWLKLMRSSLSEIGEETAAAINGKAPRAGATEDFHADAAAEFGTEIVVHRAIDRTDDAGGPSHADSLGDELAGRLSRFRWIKALVGGEARAAELLEPAGGRGGGYSIQATLAGKSVAPRLDVSLWTASRQLLWNAKFDLAEGLDERERVLAAAIAQIAARVEREEQARAHRSAGGVADFSHAIWRGRWHVNRLTNEDAAAAKRLLEQALAAAPRSPEALIQATTALCWEKWARRAPRHQFSEIRDLARRAILLDPDDCRGHWLAGVAETWLRNPAASIGLLTHAIELNPSFEPAHAQLGSTLNLFDRPREALRALMHSLDLSPSDTHVFFRYTEIGLAWSRLGDQAQAIDWIDRALLQRPAYWYARVVKVGALVESGDIAGAIAEGRELKIAYPKFSRSDMEWVPFFDRAHTGRFLASLDKAGVLEP